MDKADELLIFRASFFVRVCLVQVCFVGSITIATRIPHTADRARIMRMNADYFLGNTNEANEANEHKFF